MLLFMPFLPSYPLPSASLFSPQGQFPQELLLSESRTASVTSIVKDFIIYLFFFAFFFPLLPVL